MERYVNGWIESARREETRVRRLPASTLLTCQTYFDIVLIRVISK